MAYWTRLPGAPRLRDHLLSNWATAMFGRKRVWLLTSCLCLGFPCGEMGRMLMLLSVHRTICKATSVWISNALCFSLVLYNSWFKPPCVLKLSICPKLVLVLTVPSDPRIYICVNTVLALSNHNQSNEAIRERPIYFCFNLSVILSFTCYISLLLL